MKESLKENISLHLTDVAGRGEIYRISMEEAAMTNQIYSISEIKKMLAPVFSQYDVTRAVLFGSYGKAAATEKSDVDLLVDSGLRGLKFIGLLEAIRTVLDKNVDILDVAHVQPHSPIEWEIQNTGVLIYEK